MEGRADRWGRGARPHPHQSSPLNHSRNLSIYKNWQIYSEGAHFQEAKGEGGRGEISPFPFFLIFIFPKGVKMAWTPKPTQIKNPKNRGSKKLQHLNSS